MSTDAERLTPKPTDRVVLHEVETDLVVDVRGKPRRARVVQKPIYRKED